MANDFGLFVTTDTTKCTGCRACEMACFQSHNAKRNKVGKTVGTITVPVTPKLYVTVIETASMPIQCKHCENSPCKAVCKQSAIVRFGHQVIVDETKCIGCKDCLVACPFGAITLLPYYDKGKPVKQVGSDENKVAASKCDLCIDDPDGPACVRVCPNEALSVSDVNEDRKKKNIAAAEALAVINAGAPERRLLP
ncbi:MAG: 4Fe-4S dicluster domain-containing protein [Deltaproteobacteria bacterium]|jgi:electron transport protein HydN|nr:4Fe-4S dicluster domain-containing protein [Deltaproteobacteria bacterium]